jgi:hypothetical protein
VRHVRRNEIRAHAEDAAAASGVTSALLQNNFSEASSEHTLMSQSAPE